MAKRLKSAASLLVIEHFHEWKRLSEKDPGVVDMETLLKGVCDKKNFMDIFENFIIHDDSSGKQIKVLAKNHQYLGVNQVIKALNDPNRVKGKLGVFWHTQGAGKSYSMVFFTTKVHRKIGGNYTFLICTDRDDLDTQIYKTYAGCGVADNDKTHYRPSSGRHLAELMSHHKAYVFTTIQKFNQDVETQDFASLLDAIINANGFERNKAIVVAKEAVNENDKTRKKFEVMCREVFIKFKACLTFSEVNAYRNQYGAINIIYKSLQKDRDQADISDIIRQLQGIIDESIIVKSDKSKEPNKPFDISKIDFNRLRAEFERSKTKNTIVQSLKSVIERKTELLIQRNPFRTNFQEHYEKIIAEYNKEKDRQSIEVTFEALSKLVQELDEEESRAVREGLDEETLAIYDLLVKPDLNPKEIQNIKKVAGELLGRLKGKLKDMYEWRDKEPTRDGVKVLIHHFLWDESRGLPDCYTMSDVGKKTEDVFHHIYRTYPTVPSPYYAGVR